jgi:hypothetical protein
VSGDDARRVFLRREAKPSLTTPVASRTTLDGSGTDEAILMTPIPLRSKPPEAKGVVHGSLIRFPKESRVPESGLIEPTLAMGLRP